MSFWPYLEVQINIKTFCNYLGLCPLSGQNINMGVGLTSAPVIGPCKTRERGDFWNSVVMVGCVIIIVRIIFGCNKHSLLQLRTKMAGGCISRRGGATYCYFWSILSIHLAYGNHLLRLSGKSPLPTSVPGLHSCLGSSFCSSLAVWFRPASQCLTFPQALGIGSGWPIWVQLKHPSAIHRLQFTINFSPLCFYLGAFLSFFHCRLGACFQQLPSQGLPSMHVTP